ncbi:MAG: hypothetical protein QM764_18060 [Chitinophagaceae bacterium]
MKKIILILSGVAFFIVGLNSCKKGEINGDSSTLIMGSYITLSKVTNENLNFSDPSATVSIDVQEKGSPVESVNIYLATKANTFDPTGWKLIKNVPYSGVTTLSVTTAEIATALAPDDIVPGTQYTLQNEVVTKDGRKFSNANTPTNFQSLPGYNMALNWSATAVCAYDESASVGTYKVVSDSWADYNVGTDTLHVTAGPGANQLSLHTYPSAGIGESTDQVLTVLDVDPTTGAVTIASQSTGSYYTGTPDQTATKVSGSGFIFSCTGGISLVIDVDYGGTVYGGQKLVLLKQ